MAVKIGKDCKVVLGSATVTLMGAWSFSGITTAEIDNTAFGDDWRDYEFGIKDGGDISFNGWADAADVTGQELLQVANLENSELTTLKFYIDDTSYYEVCQTTGYVSPTLTTGYSSIPGNIRITSYTVNVDKSGLVEISFSGHASSMMVLV